LLRVAAPYFLIWTQIGFVSIFDFLSVNVTCFIPNLLTVLYGCSIAWRWLRPLEAATVVFSFVPTGSAKYARSSSLPTLFARSSQKTIGKVRNFMHLFSLRDCACRNRHSASQTDIQTPFISVQTVWNSTPELPSTMHRHNHGMRNLRYRHCRPWLWVPLCCPAKHCMDAFVSVRQTQETLCSNGKTLKLCKCVRYNKDYLRENQGRWSSI
jgi:hypothetical protein